MFILCNYLVFHEGDNPKGQADTNNERIYACR